MMLRTRLRKIIQQKRAKHMNVYTVKADQRKNQKVLIANVVAVEICEVINRCEPYNHERLVPGALKRSSF